MKVNPLLVPLWTCRWWWYAPIGVWLAINPVITPEADDMSSFATPAMLGEESWSRDPTSEPLVLAVTGAAGVSLIGAVVAGYHHKKAGTFTGTAVFMALTLLEWKLLADRFARRSGHTHLTTRRPSPNPVPSKQPPAAGACVPRLLALGAWAPGARRSAAVSLARRWRTDPWLSSADAPSVVRNRATG